jgi:hypothetical protein
MILGFLFRNLFLFLASKATSANGDPGNAAELK